MTLSDIKHYWFYNHTNYASKISYHFCHLTLPPHPSIHIAPSPLASAQAFQLQHLLPSSQNIPLRYKLSHQFSLNIPRQQYSQPLSHRGIQMLAKKGIKCYSCDYNVWQVSQSASGNSAVILQSGPQKIGKLVTHIPRNHRFPERNIDLFTTLLKKLTGVILRLGSTNSNRR